MAIWIVKNSGKISYGIKRYLCDTLEDLPYSENGEVVIPGSKAYVISEKKTYMMGSDEEWHEINEGSGSGASSMSQLTDVDLTNLEDGQVLKYDEDTQTWKPGDDASATSLGNLDDVDLTGLQGGQIIIYDSTTEKWLASDIPSDIAEVTQAQYDALPSETKNLPIIYQISDKGYFFYKGKKFRASKELTQAEYDQLTPEEQNDGTEYFITDAPETVAELTQAQYDVLTTDEKNNGTIWQISNKGYFYYKGKQFRASRELTQAEFDALPTSEKNNGTEYLITDATTSIGDIDDVSISGATDGQSLYYDATLGVWKNSAGKIVYAEIDDVLDAGETSIILTSNYITTDSVVDVFVDDDFDGVTYETITIADGSVTLTFNEQAEDMPVMIRVWIDGYGAANNIEIDDDHALPDAVWSGEKIQEEITNIYEQITNLYDNTATYNVGDTVIYNNTYYENITQITVPEDFDPDKWNETNLEERLAEKVDKTEFADEYDETISYSEGDLVVYNNNFYINITPVSEPGEAFDPTKWQEVSLADIIGSSNISSLGDLSDVDIALVTDGQVLTYNLSGNKWVPTTISTGTDVTFSNILPTDNIGKEGDIYVYGTSTNEEIEVTFYGTYEGGEHFVTLAVENETIAITPFEHQKIINSFVFNNRTYTIEFSGDADKQYVVINGQEIETTNATLTTDDPEETIVESTYVQIVRYTPSRTYVKLGSTWLDLNYFTDNEKTKVGNIPTNLNDLSDVNITSTPTDGQLLGYNGTTHKWVPVTGGGGGGTASSTTYNNTTSGLNATDVQDAIDELKSIINSLINMLGDTYDPTSSYSVGDKVIYNNNYYVCNTDIPAPGEAWNSSHWTLTNITGQMPSGYLREVVL